MIMMGCPPGLKWDDAHKRCKITSSTCGLSRPSNSSDDPDVSVEDPTESVNDPVETTEEPLESAGDPAENAEATQSMEAEANELNKERPKFQDLIEALREKARDS